LGKHAANLFLALITPLAGGKKVKFPIPSINKKDVVYLKELVEQGVYKPLIDRQYTMDQIVEAYHYVESGQKTGNVILRISQ
jgi:NADPH:quinone reductase-like Zn-dependent oxidoreductase